MMHQIKSRYTSMHFCWAKIISRYHKLVQKMFTVNHYCKKEQIVITLNNEWVMNKAIL